MNWYKNLKISIKLIIGFLIVAVITAVVGIVGTVSLNQVSDNANNIYEYVAEPIVVISEVVDLYQQNRIETRNMLLQDSDGELDAIINDFRERREQIEVKLAEYEKTIRTDTGKGHFETFTSTYSDYLEELDKIIELVQSGNKEEATAVLYGKAMETSAKNVHEAITGLIETRSVNGASQYDEIVRVSQRTKLIMIGLSVCGVVLALVLGILISRIIGKPISHIVEVAKKLALGDIDVNIEAEYNDETGQLAKAFKVLSDSVLDQTRLAERMAEGDFSVAVELRSENDTLGKALNRMIENINELLSNVVFAAEQVATGAKQISDSSMVLSEGSTEQASSVEQLTASLEEISSQTEMNAEDANKANELTSDVKVNADRGNEQMKEMLEAIEEINISSNNINRIIKVIDDIAFQTNILALNAAVEAARAGQYGKGFAVVAEEVRTLAAKSADAAKETTELIENSINKVNEGTKIARETADSLNIIVQEIDKVYELVNNIATGSNEQASGIAQINQEILQVSDVVQTNSSTAEESAAASEELASQASLLQEMVSKFKLKDIKNSKNNMNKLNPEVLTMIETMVNNSKDSNNNSNLSENKPSIILSDSEFGKY